jgi:glycosyltransferase involved in cell wall biosynthesis
LHLGPIGNGRGLSLFGDPLRFHVVSLPHTHTTDAFSACAFTEKVRKFCIMMRELCGHTVYLYAGAENEAPCDEHVPCLSEPERLAAVGDKHYCLASFDSALPHWQVFNARAVAAIAQRAQPRDFICLIGGWSNKPIADALPNMLTVEFGIGYPGTFAKYRVFESYAWMHTLYGAQTKGGAAAADGQWYDTVIPGYFERERFPFASQKQDYCCFVGRLIERKGYQIAVDVCKAMGMRLLIAGQGEPPDYGEYLGVIGPQERGELMANARACFVPTIYVEPFGNVAVEAMACGTPVITTDWGAFTETVIHGMTGFRCRTFKQFIDAVEAAPTLDPFRIREHAMANYSLEAIAPKYNDYFQRLQTLWDKGWYTR